MNILHFSTSDSEGGSARSARRIHEGLRLFGHASHMLVGSKASEDADAATVHGGGARRILDRLAEAATGRLGLQYLWYPSGGRVLAHPWTRAADIVQLYNTHGGYLSHRLLPALAQQAPVVWRLSDMWPLTGHCVYSGDCERWRIGCGACPDLERYAALPRDTTRLLWRIKQRVYAEARPTIVAPSRWLEGLARQSPLLARSAVHRIATGVDRAIYRPIDKRAAREVLGLPPQGRLVLFTAHSVDDDARKGAAAAIAALRRIAPREDLAIVLLGMGGGRWQEAIAHKVIRLGFIRDQRLLAAAYAAADLALAPSAVENLPNTVLEAMACGTPAVAFDAGGIREAVRHGETGWLAPAGDVGRLAQGVETLVADDAERERLAQGALALIAAEFDGAREAKEFASLYETLIAERRGASDRQVASFATAASRPPQDEEGRSHPRQSVP